MSGNPFMSFETCFRSKPDKEQISGEVGVNPNLEAALQSGRLVGLK